MACKSTPLICRQQGQAAANRAKAGLTVQTSTPVSLPDVGVVDSTITQRLADLYAQSFGSAADQSSLPVVAVPVNPPASSGGGVSLGKVGLVVALGVGGWFLWQKFGKRAAA